MLKMLDPSADNVQANPPFKCIHAIEAEFNEWLEKGKGKRKAVVYDQFKHSGIARHVEGTRKEVLEQYAFYKAAYPHLSLGLVCEEYYNQTKK